MYINRNFIKIAFYINIIIIIFFTFYPVHSRVDKVSRRNRRTLGLKHCVLSGRTQLRSLGSRQSEENKSEIISHLSSGNRTHKPAHLALQTLRH